MADSLETIAGNIFFGILLFFVLERESVLSSNVMAGIRPALRELPLK